MWAVDCSLIPVLVEWNCFQLSRVCLQVNPTASGLNSSDVFVLVSPGGSWEWRGQLSTQVEVKGAKHLADILKVSPKTLEEGKETGGWRRCWCSPRVF